MPQGNYRVLLEVDTRWHKLCRVFYGRDGSYYVTSPYREGDGAVLVKSTVNYAKAQTTVTFEELIDLASIEDEQHAVKLSHHPDGLVQFSGPGVRSGRDGQGNLTGMAVQSWPLDRPVAGPAFGLVIRGVKGFEIANHPCNDDVAFSEHELTLLPAPRIYVVEGHYFPPLWRRFVQTEVDATKRISILHPNGAVLRLRVLLPPEPCKRQGFLGLEIYSEPLEMEMPNPEHGFILAGSTGNLRRNEQGELLGDGIWCMAPKGQMPARRSLDYGRPNIPPVVPVGDGPEAK